MEGARPYHVSIKQSDIGVVLSFRIRGVESSKDKEKYASQNRGIAGCIRGPETSSLRRSQLYV